MADKKIFTGTVGRCISETNFSFDIKESPSKGKPNVVYIVLDDTGFAQLGCYGSTINTPNIDKIASRGLRYNNFHTTAICSATRASLLTGANHHSVGINTTTEGRTGLGNAQGGIDPQYATLAEILREYDYRTMAVGKWHLSAMDERTAAGPYHNWPLGKGFDTYYGFLAADMDQWNPVLTRDNTMVEQPKKASEGYHLSEDLTENAIQYVYNHELSYPEQPFFLYLAYGAMHTPHHAPKEYIDRYRGKFDAGWDKIREEWFENQKKLGIVNDTAELTERNEHVPAWDTLSDDQKKAYARYMEVFAGFLEHTDAQIGKFIDFLDKRGIYDNTIIVLISDNGASAEGGKDGHFNLNTSMDVTDNYPRDVELVLENYETIGDEYSQPHYPTGWANAGNTPFQWYKQWTYEGGVKDPLIISYPNYIKEKGGIRRQFNHVSDITPTVLDLLGFEKPEFIRGVPQRTLQGISFKNTLNDERAEGKKKVQYFEMHGNRSIYKDGWKAVVNHMFHKTFDEDEWELYHVDEDYSEKYNVADRYPEKLKELQEEWLIEAAKYGVFPMPDRGLLATRDSLKEYLSMISLPAVHLEYNDIIYPYDLVTDPGIGTRTGTIMVVLNRRNQNEKGVLVAKGDRFGGVSLYVKDNHINYVYNLDSDIYWTIESDFELPLGEVDIQADFTVTGKEQATAELFVNGNSVGLTEISKFFYTTGAGAPTSLKVNKHISVYDEAYAAPFTYDGEIKKVIFDFPATTVQAEEEIAKDLVHD
ncbi:MAG: arylsulfatase [Lachnospiraceae bacterium]|nr:arylsulfatase [Lachnospiraceae bacterium]